MPYRPISNDLKSFCMRLLDSETVTIEDLVANKAFSFRTAIRLRWAWLYHGRALPPPIPRRRLGRRRMVEPWMLHYIEALLRRNPTLTLRELQDTLVRAGSAYFSRAMLSLMLKRMGLTRKVTFRIAREQSQEARAAFVRQIGAYKPDQLVFIDESAVDWRNATRRWGRSVRGSKAYNRTLFHRGPHYSVLPACSLDQPIFALKIIEGSNNGQTFFDYLKDVLLPNCNAYPGPRSVIVMDNASTHHVEPIKELIEMFGECRILVTRWIVCRSRGEGERWFYAAQRGLPSYTASLPP